MLVIQNAANPAKIRNAIADLITPNLLDVRIASAYVTFSGSSMLLNAISDTVGNASFSSMPKTLITSFDFGLTEPQALRYWMNLNNAVVYVSGAQRLGQGSLMPTNAFHPKLYVFGNGDGTCNSLVGSANLTSRGFSVNTEAAWAQTNIPCADIDAIFELAQYETVELTEELLAAYEELRQAQPPSPEIYREVQPVAATPLLEAEDLPLFRLAISNGDINPAGFNAMWVQGEALQGGSRNQLELPRGGHRFFSYFFDQYDFEGNLTIGMPVIKSGSKIWDDRPLTWHGNNKMERINLPTERQGGFNYRNTAVMFRRLNDGSFELIVTPWDSDLALSWRQASVQRNTIFRLGKINSDRTAGLI